MTVVTGAGPAAPARVTTPGTPPASVRDALLAGRDRLRAAGVEGPYLDAVVLLAHVLGVAKERLFAALPEPLPETAAAPYRQLLARRCAGEPVAYLRGYKEFYGRSFVVSRDVLIPRPETELLVEAALAAGDAMAARRGRVALHDVGTGSGAVAVTVALERPGWRVGGSDLCAAAVAVAERNRRGLGAAGVRLRVCDLLPPAPAAWDLIVGQSSLPEQRGAWPLCGAGCGRSRCRRWTGAPTGWRRAAGSPTARAPACAPAAP